ncbi:MAG: HepT-like ribonuclease domain-containing protein [Aggregatilineales bacterium]
MSRTFELYLRDILKAIDRINHQMQGVDKQTFKQGDYRVDAVLYNLMVIGEAIKTIPETMRAQLPEVPWREISRFRDRIVHHYFNTDLRNRLDHCDCPSPYFACSGREITANIERLRRWRKAIVTASAT